VPVQVQAFDSSLTGTVQDEGNNPVSGVQLAIGTQSDTTDAQGHFTVYGSSGARTLSVTPSSPSVTLQAPVTLSGSTTRSLTLPLKRLTFRVLNPSNAAVNGAQVAFSAPVTSFALAPGMTATSTGNQSGSASTDSSGNGTALVLPTAGSSAASGNLVTPPGASGLTAAAFALPAVTADTLMVLHFQTQGGFGPVVGCGKADGNWHANNVSITCTASAPAGLANPGDASFQLTTNVAGGADDANASTNTHQVCDTTNACVTAGEIAGNKIDRKAPTSAITTPLDGGSYAQGQNVNASFACSDGSGSGVASCSGTVANGSPIDTSTTGSHTFTVQAADNVGNPATKTVSYTVSSLASDPCAASGDGSACTSVASTPGLIDYWRLDGSTTDLVGGQSLKPGGANLSYIAGATGDGDKALRIFNGSPGGKGYLTLTPSVDMSGRKPWTIEFWWKDGTTITSRRATAFGNFNGGGSTGCSPAVCLYMSASDASRSVLARGDYTFTNPAWMDLIDYDSTFTQPQWTLLAVTYDGTTERLYKDGKLMKQLTSTVSLGQNPITQFFTSNDAYWDDLAIYDHALSAAQLLAHYQAR
jgi:hypothetical protein